MQLCTEKSRHMLAKRLICVSTGIALPRRPSKECIGSFFFVQPSRVVGERFRSGAACQLLLLLRDMAGLQHLAEPFLAWPRLSVRRSTFGMRYATHRETWLSLRALLRFLFNRRAPCDRARKSSSFLCHQRKHKHKHLPRYPDPGAAAYPIHPWGGVSAHQPP